MTCLLTMTNITRLTVGAAPTAATIITAGIAVGKAISICPPILNLCAIK